MSENEPRSTDDIVNALFETLGSDVTVSDEEGITLQSNAGGEETIRPIKENMTVRESLIQAGITPRADHEYIVDGVAVDGDEIVQPGAQIYIHTVVEGG